MYFENGKIERIAVISGVEGNYYPEKLVRNKISSYSLAGFVYYENRPLKNGFPSPSKKIPQGKKSQSKSAQARNG